MDCGVEDHPRPLFCVLYFSSLLGEDSRAGDGKLFAPIQKIDSGFGGEEDGNGRSNRAHGCVLFFGRWLVSFEHACGTCTAIFAGVRVVDVSSRRALQRYKYMGVCIKPVTTGPGFGCTSSSSPLVCIRRNHWLCLCSWECISDGEAKI